MAVSETVRVTRLDRAVLIVVLVLLVLIGGTILLGDRVGVQLTQIAPLDEAHSTSPVTIRFNEAMDHDSVTARFRTEPALEGVFSWSGTNLTFQPAEALVPGDTYTVALEAGALSESGRALLSEYRSSFTVARPRVAYLYPANGNPTNVWIVDPADPENPEQITNSPTGIYDYGVSPDGAKIAFSENNLSGDGSDIKLIDLQSGALEQLTNCQRAACIAPIWRPDGRMIAYTRAEQDPQFGSSPQRIWLLDLTTTPATTRPLFQQNQILGYDAQWSADGTRLALVDRGSVAILIYDFTDDNIISISSQAGDSGSLSPDGTRLVYPDRVPDLSGALMNKMRMVAVDTGEFTAVSADEEPVNDQRALWSPDNRHVAIARQDAREGRTIQIVIYDSQTQQFTPLTTEMRYSNLLFWWDPTGRELVAQRFPELDENLQPNPGLPEIWTIDVATGAGQKLVTNAFLPHWVP
ncbi:MAG: Ig-like domain-containing protein [Chloroflexota bacterium]